MENVRDRDVVAGHDDLVSFCGFLSPSVSDIVAVGMYFFCLFSPTLVLLHVPLFHPFLRAFAFPTLFRMAAGITVDVAL